MKADKIALPRKGEVVLLDGPTGEQARLRKCSSGHDWCLKKIGVNDHCRFGNAAEIRKDIEHFLLCGSLPRGERW